MAYLTFLTFNMSKPTQNNRPLVAFLDVKKIPWYEVQSISEGRILLQNIR